MSSTNKLWESCLNVYSRSKHPKEPTHFRERREGELVAPFYNQDKEVVAFISFTPLSDESCVLNCCYVLPEHQGKGIATSLLKQLLAKCPHVFTETGNVVAFDLYKKLGLFVRWRPYGLPYTPVSTEVNSNEQG